MPKVTPIRMNPTIIFPNISPPVPAKSARLTEPVAEPLCKAVDGAAGMGASPEKCLMTIRLFLSRLPDYFRWLQGLPDSRAHSHGGGTKQDNIDRRGAAN